MIYSMQWIVGEKRYLAQMKKATGEMKEQIKSMDVKKLMAFQKTTIPLQVRLFYINEYYNIARQVYKKQYLDYHKDLEKFMQLLAKSSASKLDQKHSLKVKRTSTLEEGAPVFKTNFDEQDLLLMINEGLQTRHRHAEIYPGSQYKSKAL